MELINALQSTILTELSVYQFLTVSKFQILTGGKSAGYLREMLGSLSRRSYIKSYRIEVSYKVRSESMYFLLPKGIEFLQSHKNALTNINAPINANVVAVKDYYHRLSVVSIHIAIALYFRAYDLPLVCFYTYYNKTGSSKKGTLTAKTAIQLADGTYIPDAVFKTEKGLYLLEQYCDRDIKRILAQLSIHTKAIAQGAPAKSFNLPVNACVLCAFTYESTKEAVIKRLQQSPGFAPMAHLFFFASLEAVISDCGNAWKDIHNNTLVFT